MNARAWTDNEPRTPEHDALDAEWKAILTADVAPSRFHRALPLDVVEARARAARVAWADSRAAATLNQRFPHCDGACESGRSNCGCRDLMPAEAATEIGADDQSVSADREVGMLILKALGVLLAACLAAWFLAGGPGSDAVQMAAAFWESFGVF